MINEERAILFPEAYPHRRRSMALEGMVNTLEWMLIALILAFVFRAFVMEAFRIPTGSMAETLRGQHFHLRCLACGYPFDLGPRGEGAWPLGSCTNCDTEVPEESKVTISNGDRILVAKCLYQFIEPNRWDVVVFKNPLNPQENYIKRLVGRPGEQVEIVDGDIYIDGRIARKPPKVQDELWMPVYENDYQPSAGTLRPEPKDRPRVRYGNRHRWRQPFENQEGSGWNLAAEGPTVFSLASETGQVHVLQYNPSAGKDFRTTYGYNEAYLNQGMPTCSDLMVRMTSFFPDRGGMIGAELEKGGIVYRGFVRSDGVMEIGQVQGGEYQMIDDFEPVAISEGWPVPFQFSVVDREVVLTVGRHRLRCELGQQREQAGKANPDEQPIVRILGSGNVTLRHIGVFRDIYYINTNLMRAGEGSPFSLGADEFFVCGDNSPNSLDARLWAVEGQGNNGQQYRMGVVPRDYMMGKAFFVYWSNAFRPTANLPPMLPNLSEIGFIVGGTPGSN
jgi:signal peptidase I